MKDRIRDELPKIRRKSDCKLNEPISVAIEMMHDEIIRYMFELCGSWISNPPVAGMKCPLRRTAGCYCLRFCGLNDH